MSDENLKALSGILMSLPSEHREDYPKSVPNHVIKKFSIFCDKYRESIHGIIERDRAKNEKIKKLEEREKVLMEVAEFYSDPRSWIEGRHRSTGVVVDNQINRCDLSEEAECFYLGGKTAREALRKLEEMK